MWANRRMKYTPYFGLIVIALSVIANAQYVDPPIANPVCADPRGCGTSSSPSDSRDRNHENNGTSSSTSECGFFCSLDEWAQERANRRAEKQRQKAETKRIEQLRAEFNRLRSLRNTKEAADGWLEFYNRTGIPLARYNWAIVAYNLGDYKSAHYQFDLMARECNDSRADLQSATNLCADSLRMKINSLEAWGDRDYNQRQYRDAEAHYMQSTAEGARNPGAWWGLSRARDAEGSWESALEAAVGMCQHAGGRSDTVREGDYKFSAESPCLTTAHSQFSQQFWRAVSLDSWDKGSKVSQSICKEVGRPNSVSEVKCGLLNIPMDKYDDRTWELAMKAMRFYYFAYRYDEATGVPNDGARIFYAEFMFRVGEHSDSSTPNYAEAEKQMRIVLRHDPTNAEALRFLAEVQWKEKASLSPTPATGVTPAPNAVPDCQHDANACWVGNWKLYYDDAGKPHCQQKEISHGIVTISSVDCSSR
jgi:tetratricopeptide (TPR) repeat protein